VVLDIASMPLKKSSKDSVPLVRCPV
jgi:hypothetical protein